ncbi:uncharacterized protein LOC114263087 [Camellia sinensis]|uniref:uncharacterized protein LOC114263087 n=1 Tax=Camellia sinensis TaxID=4442 RepID=UPI001036CBBF|nr:uncharacterized protein LOC114263087 [Camellia sinensis]
MVGGSGCHVVDVIVGDKRVMEVNDGNSCRIDSVTCESSFVNDCDDVGGLLCSFYPEPERVLLSASWKGIIHSVGQEFEGGVPGFRIALAKYAVECGFAVNYLKNDATRVTAECMMKSSTGYKWFMHGRVLMDSGVFFIMKLDNVHTCGVVARRSCSKMVGSRLVCDIVQNDISDNPLTRPIEVKKKLKKQYGIDVSYRVAWLGVDKARGGLFGDFATSFDQLRWYLETAMRTNPGSVFELDVDESSGCFRRLFVAFHGCLYGFQFCRLLLFVDGTFLKGRYKGHLLAATSKDGNQGLFPLAFAIVDAENQDNWMWFLSQLLKAVGSGRRLTFVSDRQHGLLDALSVVFPNAHHAYCLNHLKRNLIDKLVGLRTNYKLCLMKILVKCAYAPTVASFQHYMEKLRRIAGNGRVDSMLDGLQNDKWANAFFRGKRYGEMSSNAAESYNNWICGARELPITCMVDMIRVQIMTQLSDRRAECRRWTTKLCPVMEKKLVDSLELAKSWDVIVASDTVLETCSCHEWQLNGFPCCHALRSSGRDVYGFIDPFFHVDCFKESYKESVYPVPSSERFDFDGASSSVIKPPITKKQPGRNKKKRIPSRGENVKQIKCGRCLKYGNHNKKTCKAAI